MNNMKKGVKKGLARPLPGKMPVPKLPMPGAPLTRPMKKY